VPVLFPFGHGLSYTQFSYSSLSASTTATDLKVSVKVKNTGERDGAEVVQVYVSQKSPSIKRPVKELKGFKKVLLKKGEEKVVDVSIELKYATSFWDEIREAWIMERDEYEVKVGHCSHRLALTDKFSVGKTSWWNGL
jgi:beta-glucosidase